MTDGAEVADGAIHVFGFTAENANAFVIEGLKHNIGLTCCDYNLQTN